MKFKIECVNCALLSINRIKKVNVFTAGTVIFRAYQSRQKKMNQRILITGSTGNVGIETIHYLLSSAVNNGEIMAGVRDIEKSKTLFSNYPNLYYRYFDFENADSWQPAFTEIDMLFLLRPPQIANLQLFDSLLDTALRNGIRKIVFLSVQDADRMSYIPHAKIEKLIQAKGMPYVFLRPSYFMQNLTTTLAADIKNRKIVLPAANAPFNWVDVANIGEVAASVLLDFETYTHQALEITGSENLSFPEVVSLINAITHMGLSYESPSLLRFFLYKKRQGVTTPMILVMIMLHFLPRFRKPPHISDTYHRITGKNPTLLSEYIGKTFPVL